MRILLTGRRGQVGGDLEHILPALGEVIATDRSTLDLADPDAIRRAVREVRPDVIVNAAAYTTVDRAESEPQLAAQINAIAPGVLAAEATGLGALLVHYSTDYVFDGESRTPYTERDVPNPISRYARTKLDGELAVVASGCRYLVLRTSWVYSLRAANFYAIIRRKAQADEPMKMVDDQVSVPTPSAFLAQKSVALIRRQVTGLLNLVPSGEASRYQFASEVVRAMGSRSTVTPAKTADFPAPARRPTYSVLDNRCAAQMLAEPLSDWKELLRSHL